MWPFKSSPKKTELDVPPENRIWIEDCLFFLIVAYGFPKKEDQVVTFTRDFFPSTFDKEEMDPQWILQDLLDILELDQSSVKHAFYSDISNVENMPFGMEGDYNPSETRTLNGVHTIYLLESLKKQPSQLIHRLVYEVALIYLLENGQSIEEITEQFEFTELFIYVAGVYLGFGILLSSGLSEVGFRIEGDWEQKWHIIPNFPPAELMLAMVIHSKLKKVEYPKWIVKLSLDDQKLFRNAWEYTDSTPSEVLNEKSLKALQHFAEAKQELIRKNFTSWIELYRKGIDLLIPKGEQHGAMHDIGYRLLLADQYDLALPFFDEVLDKEPHDSYALDNKGYCLIQLGKLEEGLSFVEKSMAIADNQDGYSYRNLGLYHQAKGNPAKSEECFKKALEYDEYHVDLLHYHYALFLESKGDLTGAIEHLEKSANFKEEQGIEKLKSLRESE